MFMADYLLCRRVSRYDISMLPPVTACKLPNPDALRAEYSKLTKEKDRLYQEYGKLKKQVKQLDTLKANVDKILNVPGQDRPAVDL